MKVVLIFILFIFARSNAICQTNNKLGSAKKEVVLTAPSEEWLRQSSLETYNVSVNKKGIYCSVVDSISGTSSITKLHLSSNTLLVLIPNEVVEKFRQSLKQAFLKRMVCVEGTIIRLKDRYAIEIQETNQIRLSGE